MATRELYYIREFLNKPGFHSTAFVHAYVRKHEGIYSGNEGVTASLAISDCSRKVILELDSNSAAQWANTHRKLTILRDAVDSILNAMTDVLGEPDENAEIRDDDIYY